MNERIAKLYDQAIVIEDGGDYVCGELDPIKFAELIVRECVEQGKQIQSQTIIGGSEDYISGREMGTEVFINQIKRHFGVEE